MDEKYNVNLDEDNVRKSKAYKDSKKKAEKLVNDRDALEQFLNNLEKQLEAVPHIGGVLSNIPVMISLVRSCISGEYTQLPIASLIAIVAALVYYVSPIDLIPDIIPVIGKLDDAAVIAITLAMVNADVETYKQWRDNRLTGSVQGDGIKVDATIK